MAKVHRSDLTKAKIIQVAARRFLENGYSNTSIKAIADELGMSTGNLTFYYPTKEHLLAELTGLLCSFQGWMVETTVGEGKTSLLAICQELTAMAAMCEENPQIKDFFLCAYSHPLSLEVIRQNDCQRAKTVFKEFCPDWTEEHFAAAETIVSGIEYATMMTTENSAPLETRIREAIVSIMTVYGVPEEVRNKKISKVLSGNYQKKAHQFMDAFFQYVDQTTEQAMESMINSWLGRA